MLTSIYSYSLTSVSGGAVDLGSYSGRQMLLVNIASGGSGAAAQMAGLEQLYQQHRDSLVVIAFPSNSFGNEPMGNAGLAAWAGGTVHVTFPVVCVGSVAGASASGVYSWLADAAQNGTSPIGITGDFQKVLIGTDGRVKAVFGSSVPPTDQKVQKAISIK